MLLAPAISGDLSWLESQKADLSKAFAAGKAPHAVLIHGPAGTGRRQLARWIAEQVLQSTLDENDQHPDCFEIVPIDDKQLSVDQVREMISFMQLTSHQQGGKVAAVYPADKLTNNAANSLLKTLEEPPKGAALILVCEDISYLPVTVVSRCQQVRVAAPPHEVGLAWLQSQSADDNWSALLEFCGNAPLFALEMFEAKFIDDARSYAQDLHAIQLRRADPVSVAKRWAKNDISLCLRWLYIQSAKIMRKQAEDRNATQYTEACYVYLRELARLKQVQKSGFNMELNLARLLHAWYGGFKGL